jgi:hypothetical protein
MRGCRYSGGQRARRCAISRFAVGDEVSRGFVHAVCEARLISALFHCVVVLSDVTARTYTRAMARWVASQVTALVYMPSPYVALSGRHKADNASQCHFIISVAGLQRGTRRLA